MRSAQEVFEDQLRQSEEGMVEDDLRRNYAEDVLILTSHGEVHGHGGVRRFNRELQEPLSNATDTYWTRRIKGQLAFLEWTALSEEAVVRTRWTPTCFAMVVLLDRRSTTR